VTAAARATAGYSKYKRHNCLDASLRGQQSLEPQVRTGCAFDGELDRDAGLGALRGEGNCADVGLALAAGLPAKRRR